MKTENKALPKNKINGSKPVQEDKPTSQQKPMGSDSDINKNAKRIKENAEEDNKDTNSVGVFKKGKSSPLP